MATACILSVDAARLVAAGSLGSGHGWLAGALADRRLGLVAIGPLGSGHGAASLGSGA